MSTLRRRHSRHLAKLVVLASTLMMACGDFLGSDDARDTTLFVAPQRVPCVGVGPQSCLRVREPSQAEWGLFYDSIEGFAFEPGFEYELRVRISRVKNPPADASSLAYRLIRLVRKTPASS